MSSRKEMEEQHGRILQKMRELESELSVALNNIKASIGWLERDGCNRPCSEASRVASIAVSIQKTAIRLAFMEGKFEQMFDE